MGPRSARVRTEPRREVPDLVAYAARVPEDELRAMTRVLWRRTRRSRARRTDQRNVRTSEGACRAAAAGDLRRRRRKLQEQYELDHMRVPETFRSGG